MQLVRLGRSGLEVSRICLGCMSFGIPDQGGPKWSLPEEESRTLIKAAVEAGINFFDTANIYSDGSSEEIVGRALRDFARRDEIVLATKLNAPMRPGPNARGLSRKAIMQEIDHSLMRLGVDYVDLYQIHRWDPITPVEETLEALTDIIKAGKVRYIGASSMNAWKFAKAIYLSDKSGWSRFISMQNHYNLLNREEEREMLPLCAAEGIGVIPWSPLARGLLARKRNVETARHAADQLSRKLYGDTEEADGRIIDAVGRVAERRGVSRAQIALAWLLAKPAVTAPIVGAGKLEHLTDGIAATSIELDAAEVEELERDYVPHAVKGYE